MTLDTIFGDVHAHPRVCSNCFHLRHTETPVPDEVKRLAQRTVWASAVTPRWTRTRHAHSAAPPGDSVGERSPTTVCECGSVGRFTSQWSPGHPLDVRTAITYTDNLSDTLRELSREAHDYGATSDAAKFAHDRDALFDTVRDLKTTPKYNRQDGRIFSVATDVACRRRDEPVCATRGDDAATAEPE